MKYDLNCFASIEEEVACMSHQVAAQSEDEVEMEDDTPPCEQLHEDEEENEVSSGRSFCLY